MCIAILKTKKGIISDKELKNSFDNNPDGAGIAYTVKNKLIIQKGINTSTDLIKAVREAEKVCDSNMLIHCRIGTSGVKTEYNTHPFRVNDNVCLIHNGILDVDVPFNSKENDTQIFIRRYLNKLNSYELMHNEQIHLMIKELIGNGNKFVLLDNKGYYKIINEKAGSWKNNVWFSNTSYAREKVTYNTNWYKGNSWKNSYWEDEYYYDETKDDWVEIQRTDMMLEAVYELSDADFMRIGGTPIWWDEENMIISLDDYEEAVTDYPEDTFSYLDETNPEVYNEYIDYYKQIEEVNNEQDENISVA